jgi:hypothetical protein
MSWIGYKMSWIRSIGLAAKRVHKMTLALDPRRVYSDPLVGPSAIGNRLIKQGNRVAAPPRTRKFARRRVLLVGDISRRMWCIVSPGRGPQRSKRSNGDADRGDFPAVEYPSIITAT